jgi:AraC family transcriptional regulator of adaptative response/methylated-DNA-[protein]-cysteine methyltransferase
MMMNTAVMPADTRWTAVMARDRAADGRFVYAVRSTGVYCRPSCPSRRPTRSAVDFFPGGVEARAAGYRACKRCRPDETAGDPWVERIRRACVYLSNVDGHPTLETLARRVGGSPYHLQRSFKRIVGMTPREYVDARRLDKVKRRLRQGDDVTSALVSAGFSSPSRFYEGGGHRLGMPPSSYRKGGAGATIAFATRPTPVGVLLLAATERGVCAIAMGDNAAALRRALAEEFPAATLVQDATRLDPWLTRAMDHVSGWSPSLDLPLDVRATAFQWQVWSALARIPRGQTRSYAQVAAAIGRPSAARAVARACASNPVALAIPCHRVVPAAGGIGGYRWGRKRKAALLAAEAGERLDAETGAGRR